MAKVTHTTVESPWVRRATYADFYGDGVREGILSVRTGGSGSQIKLTPEQAIELGDAMAEWGHERCGPDDEAA